MMVFLGVVALIVGLGGLLLAFTGAVASLMPALEQIPGGLIGWAVVAGAGLLSIVLFRRPSD